MRCILLAAGCPKLRCPCCKSDEHVVEGSFSPALRKFVDVQGMGLILTQQYTCTNPACAAEGKRTKHFLATDDDVISQLPLYVRNEFPVILTKGSGVGSVYAECVARDQVNGTCLHSYHPVCPPRSNCGIDGNTATYFLPMPKQAGR